MPLVFTHHKINSNLTLSMTHFHPSINVGGHLMELHIPQIMGILNVTPDSFYAAERSNTQETIACRARRIIAEGGSIIDVGAFSSRPGASEVSVEEEMSRLRFALSIIRKEVPESTLSVDTFRADVARMCVEEFGVEIINDISGGQLDKSMFKTVARLGVPYVLTHLQGTPENMQDHPEYSHLMKDVFLYFSQRIMQLHDLGVKDIIIDPGFGFGKTLIHNYELLAHLDDFKELGQPILTGVSRKSMIYRLLNTTPDNALNGTTALHAIALEKGANLLRVHDVRAAVEVVKIHQQLHHPSPSNTPTSL